jgi:hypothetical protein
LLISAAALVTLPGGLHAQGVELGVWGGRTWSNEVTTGITICTADGCHSSRVQPTYGRTAWDGGLNGQVRVHDRFAVEAGASLALKGFGPGPGASDTRVDSRTDPDGQPPDRGQAHARRGRGAA